jgi:hypothetical protein
MSSITEVHEPALPSAQRSQTTPPSNGSESTIRHALRRIIFWSYPRGGWQYDVVVIAILAFIFLSPRSWFNDRPTLQLANLRHLQGIVEMNRVSNQVTYLVDARLVESLGQKPEDAIPVILKQHLLRTFTVKSIDLVRDRHQVILGYTVIVEE